MEKLLEKLNISPNYDDYRQVTYQLIWIANQISTIKIEIAKLNNELKDIEADMTLELKSMEKKPTEIEIKSLIRQKQKEKNLLILENKNKLEKLEWSIDSINKFLSAVDWSLYYINSIKNV